MEFCRLLSEFGRQKIDEVLQVFVCTSSNFTVTDSLTNLPRIKRKIIPIKFTAHAESFRS